MRVRVLILCLGVALLASCGRISPRGQPPEQSYQDEKTIQNSSQTLSANYSLKSVESDYRVRDSGKKREVVYSFSSDGTFSREYLKSGATQSKEEGSYVLGTKDQLALYVEKVSGEALGAARAEYYLIVDQSGDVLELRRGLSETSILVRR